MSEQIVCIMAEILFIEVVLEVRQVPNLGNGLGTLRSDELK